MSLFFSKELIEEAQKVLQNCLHKNLKISCAESCTGGLLSALLTEVSGSSKVFQSGFVTYSNQAKIDLLQVREKTLENYGAVSSEVALEMAFGALLKSFAITPNNLKNYRSSNSETSNNEHNKTENKNFDKSVFEILNFYSQKNYSSILSNKLKNVANFCENVAISITGIAGPEGGSKEKPVGTVFIGFASSRTIFANKFLFEGSRSEIRFSTIYEALKILILSV